MNIEELIDYQFYLSVGYLVAVASVITIILMEIYKAILRKQKILVNNIDPDKKDNVLARTGRIIAIIVYSLIYFLNEYLLKHTIVFNEGLAIGLLSGGTLTLTFAKGLYTSIRQYQKKRGVYARLEVAEKELKKIEQKTIVKSGITLKQKENK